MKLLPIPLATRLLDHIAPESLSGDLLEELHSGRSQAWYWRQTLSAIAVALSTKSRTFLLPLAFSACWSSLYPAVSPILLHTLPLQALFARDWPYSSALQGIGSMAPVLLFLWIGFFLYLALRSPAIRLSLPRLFASLSLSINVFFIACLLQPSVLSRLDHHPVSQANPSAHLFALIVPSFVSLFSAILCMTPKAHPSRRTNSRAG
jgi:hypothetical protein